MDTPEYSIVIPAYNEEARVTGPIEDTCSYFREKGTSFEIVVVDDGSEDDTASVVRSLGDDHPQVDLIRLPENRGKGFAVRTGVANSVGRFVLFMDADGATPISEVERLRAPVDEGADIAIGSRAMDAPDVDVNTRVYRRLIGRVFHVFVSTLTVGDFKDTQCGFKLLKGPVARDLFGMLRMEGFSFDVELLTLAVWHDYRVEEVPVNWTHVPGSRVNLVSDSIRMLRDLFAIRSRLIRGEYGARAESRGIEQSPADDLIVEEKLRSG